MTNIKEAQGSSSVPQESSSVPASAFTIMVRSALVEENTPTSIKIKRVQLKYVSYINFHLIRNQHSSHSGPVDHINKLYFMSKCIEVHEGFRVSV